MKTTTPALSARWKLAPEARRSMATIASELVMPAAGAGAGYALGAGYRRITSPLEAAPVFRALALPVVVAVWSIHGRRTKPAGDLAA
jgi:hypothetical protein